MNRLIDNEFDKVKKFNQPKKNVHLQEALYEEKYEQRCRESHDRSQYPPEAPTHKNKEKQASKKERNGEIDIQQNRRGT